MRVTHPISRMSLVRFSLTIPVNPSMYWYNMSNRESQKPIVYIDTAMEFAMVNMIPMAPPNSGPSDLEIM